MSPLEPYQQKMIELFIEQELKLAELYRMLSEKFPEQKNFWFTIHREELEHAQWVEDFLKQTETGTVAFQENKTRAYTVQAFLVYVKKALDKVRSGVSYKQAVSLAKGMEESLLERKIFDHFPGDSPALIAVLRKLHEESAEHLEKIKKLWLRVKDTP
jgi:hypothetical protein